MSDYHLLSTRDNPFNPHTEWDDWYLWDEARYQSLSLLARVTRVADDLPVELEEQAIDDAIDEIVRENASGMHIKIPRPTASPEAQT